MSLVKSPRSKEGSSNPIICKPTNVKRKPSEVANFIGKPSFNGKTSPRSTHTPQPLKASKNKNDQNDPQSDNIRSTTATTLQRKLKVDLSSLKEKPSDAVISSRASAVLDLLPQLESNPEEILQQLNDVLSSWDNSSVLSIEINLYEKMRFYLFNFISSKINNPPIAIKAIEICSKIVPRADRDSFLTLSQLIHFFTCSLTNGEMFLNILPFLMNLMFDQLGEISDAAASALANLASVPVLGESLIKLGIQSSLCKTLQTYSRKNRFAQELSMFISHVMNVFAALFDFHLDFEVFQKYLTPIHLISIINIYGECQPTKVSASKLLAIMLSKRKFVDLIEDEEIEPSQLLILVKDFSILEFSLIALSNAASSSDAFAERLVPFSQYFIDVLQSQQGLQVKLNVMKILAVISKFSEGRDNLIPFLKVFIPFLDLPLSDLEDLTVEEMIIASIFVIFKHLAQTIPKKICAILSGRMESFIYYGLVDYIVHLLAVLQVVPEGEELLAEVIHYDEVAFLIKLIIA